MPTRRPSLTTYRQRAALRVLACSDVLGGRGLERPHGRQVGGHAREAAVRNGDTVCRGDGDGLSDGVRDERRRLWRREGFPGAGARHRAERIEADVPQQLDPLGADDAARDLQVPGSRGDRGDAVDCRGRWPRGVPDRRVSLAVVIDRPGPADRQAHEYQPGHGRGIGQRSLRPGDVVDAVLQRNHRCAGGQDRCERAGRL